MRKLLVPAFLVFAVAALTLAGIAQGYDGNGARARGASVRITQVSPNSKTGCVSLRLDLRGWKMYPGEIGTSTNRADGGHYHIYVNGKYWSASANAKRARACGLATGATYQLQVVLAYNDHTQIGAHSQVVSAILRGTY